MMHTNIWEIALSLLTIHKNF